MGANLTFWSSSVPGRRVGGRVRPAADSRHINLDAQQRLHFNWNHFLCRETFLHANLWAENTTTVPPSSCCVTAFVLARGLITLQTFCPFFWFLISLSVLTFIYFTSLQVFVLDVVYLWPAGPQKSQNKFVLTKSWVIWIFVHISSHFVFLFDLQFFCRRLFLWAQPHSLVSGPL